MKKYVYFGERCINEDLLGGKGANLAEMTNRSPVPQDLPLVPKPVIIITKQ